MESKIKFTEALMLGAMLLRPVQGQVLDVTGEGGCAHGMAGLAAGLELWPSHLWEFGEKTEEVNERKILARWPWLKTKIYRGQACDCFRMPSLFVMVHHLFDVHDWSAQQIAEWLRPIEAELDRPTGIERMAMEEAEEARAQA